MCGIAGILTRDVRGDEARRVADMQRALRHRGPDDAGVWHSPSGRATLAHTRLAILDPTSAGRQPMSTADDRFTIALNGAIYNFSELRRSLESKGIAFRSRSDTEVVLRAYEVYGEACVRHLRGMFALAIWDEREQTCLLARDPFGIKPLYYYARESRLVFASEVKSLLQSGEVPRRLDSQAVYEYLRAGSVQDPRTLLREVRGLDAGRVMTWNGDVRTSTYWDLSFGEAEPAAAPGPATHEALRDSVRHHFASDVAVGVFLSGGIDSTSLVALAAEAGFGSLRTFTLSIEGTDDEGERARRTAGHFGANHHECRVDAAAGRRLFGDYLAAMDQPSIDGLNTFAVSRLAAERGTKVMLSGIGADELFGGYPTFSHVPRMTAWRRWLGESGRLHAAGAQALSASGDPRQRRLADLLLLPPSLTASYAVYRGIFSRREAGVLAAQYSGTNSDDCDDAVEADALDPTPADGVCRLELSRYLRNQLLRDGDVMSMACGVEVRTPFLDTVVVDTVRRIPASQRLRPGKRMLVESVTGLPDGVVHRRKRCFQFPFERWMDGEWRQIFAAVEKIGPVATTTWYQKWCLLVLEHWLTTTGVDGERSWM
jgi:asparagine synthase (glutamine-hydrolysing)